MADDWILGFNCNVFNAAAALVRDGRVVAAAQEERFSRVRHTGAFPAGAIRACLDQAGIGIDDLAHVGFHWQPFHRFHRRLLQVASGLPASLRFADSHGGRWWHMIDAPRELARRFPHRGQSAPYRFHRVRHHLCHAASAFFASPFEQAAVLTVDGSGEIASSTFGVGCGGEIRPLGEILFPHSLGYLYVALTHYLGFVPDSDEYKVMALAASGTPDRYAAFAPLVRLEPQGRFSLDLRYMNFQRGIRNPWVSGRFVREFGPLRRPGQPLEQRHLDIAFALQRRLEETLLHLTRHLRRLTGLDRLCYAGGTALNSVANSRLLAESGFREMYVQPAANDAGTAIGSALQIQHRLLGAPRTGPLEHVYLGPAYDDDCCAAALRRAGLPFETLAETELVAETARLLEQGRVVGWFQGRMEMGPRALGNRSIIADPRRPEMKDRINAAVKHREPFRPFAPAVPLERAAEFFEIDRPSPFMLFVHAIRPEKLPLIPAVAHVDGTARVQTVDRSHNRLFHRLIEAFAARTGVPVVLNTSFNVMGEPIVCTPEEAIRCFLGTGIDALALGPHLARKTT